jgi:hypothetical protein
MRLSEINRNQLDAMISSARGMYEKITGRFPDLTDDERLWLRDICATVAVSSSTPQKSHAQFTAPTSHGPKDDD